MLDNKILMEKCFYITQRVSSDPMLLNISLVMLVVNILFNPHNIFFFTFDISGVNTFKSSLLHNESNQF